MSTLREVSGADAAASVAERRPRSPDAFAFVEPARARVITTATWLALIVYAYPGYMSWDVDEQLLQVRGALRGDWHPPVLVGYWRWFELFMHGPLPLLLLQASLFVWGIRRIARRYVDAVTAAWLTMIVVLLPPIFAPMSVVWKDAQMAAFLIAGVALATEQAGWRRAIGVVLLVAAMAVRDNAALALPPLSLWIASTWLAHGRMRRLAVATAMTIAICGAAFVANHALVQAHEHPWYRSVAIDDIAGTICNDASISDVEIQRLLADTGLRSRRVDRASLCSGYAPRVWFSLVFGASSTWQPLPTKPERLARLATWRELVRTHPRAYLAHRWHVFREVLGLTDAAPWEPVCQTLNANDDYGRELHHDASLSWFQRRVGGALRASATTIVFRPWLYALIAIALLGYALVKRLGAVAAVVGSGLCFELGYFVAGAAPDFRYSHWMITCAVLGVALALAARRQARYLAGG